MIITQSNLMSGKKTLVPFNLIADVTYGAGGSNSIGACWQSPTDYVGGTTGIAVFNYPQNGQKYLSTASRTVPLPFDPSTNYYFELHITASASNMYVNAITVVSLIATNTAYTTNYTGAPGIYTYNGGGYGGQGSLGGAIRVGDVLQVAYRGDNHQVFFGKNGYWPNDPTSGTSGVLGNVSVANPPCLCFAAAGNTGSQQLAGTFNTAGLTYAVPTGYVAVMV